MYDVWCFVVFFFKQKTAYEMRISDWSSDVCSSDLTSTPPRAVPSSLVITSPVTPAVSRNASIWLNAFWPTVASSTSTTSCGARSEEHTSELQSLMRISYAVFCLKKKTTTNHATTCQPLKH